MMQARENMPFCHPRLPGNPLLEQETNQGEFSPIGTGTYLEDCVAGTWCRITGQEELSYAQQNTFRTHSL